MHGRTDDMCIYTTIPQTVLGIAIFCLVISPQANVSNYVKYKHFFVVDHKDCMLCYY